MPVLEQLRARIVRQGPSLLRIPLTFMPFALQRQVLQQLLHWQFRQALADGELEFLASRWLEVEVRDLGLRWYVTVENERLRIRADATPDVRFSADANDLILIAARRRDPDTLFFQRRLCIEGDTELGLYVKNLMDAVDLETLPPVLRQGLTQMADFIEAGIQQDTATLPRAGELC